MPLARKHRRVLWIAFILLLVYFFPRSSKRADRSNLPVLNVAVITDSQRLDFALQVAKSASYFTATHRLHFHLVAPRLFHDTLEVQLNNINAVSTLYDYDYCLNLATTLRPYTDSSETIIHTSALCKAFLSHIIPHDRVLYIDTDAVVSSDLGRCYKAPTSPTTLYSMAVDLGDACQNFPQRCWPAAYAYQVPEGFVCGNLPQRYAPHVYETPGARCSKAGESEPAYLNGGKSLSLLKRSWAH
jgi:hypothetical protein